ncbi:hypothetical protein EU347_20715, partial [Salmonella enterica subsp. enterica serovar Typhisuis]|nr:hypothetical protein [Salmonella enterica subsp. enterica serovar Albany]ECG2226249.1 hypothetical protein [Salmonella enterica subsp. enterica serovar Typhisuis]
TARHQIKQRAQSKDWAFLHLSLYGKSYRLMAPTRFKHLRRVDKNRFSKRDFPPYIRLNHRM